MQRITLTRAVRPFSTPLSLRTLYTTVPRSTSDFSRPSPPPLPPKQQAEWEESVRRAQTAPETPKALAGDANKLTEEERAQLSKFVLESQHPDLRRGPKPEFEGEVNPKTGEIGGPKNDPFVAGNADWQFGGRVTDF